MASASKEGSFQGPLNKHKKNCIVSIIPSIVLKPLSLPLLLTRLCTHKHHQPICAHGFWSLQWEAQGPTPDELRQNAKGPRHTKQHSVVVHLLHAIVLQRGWEKSNG